MPAKRKSDQIVDADKENAAAVTAPAAGPSKKKAKTTKPQYNSWREVMIEGEEEVNASSSLTF